MRKLLRQIPSLALMVAWVFVLLVVSREDKGRAICRPLARRLNKWCQDQEGHPLHPLVHPVIGAFFLWAIGWK